VTGVWFVVAGKPILVVALVAGSVSVAAALAAALVRALHARKEATDRPARRPVRTFLGGNAMTFVSVVAYAAVAATFLLHAQAPYLLNHLDVVLAGVPLFIGMGLVEWRARRFGEQARALLRRVRYPRQFVRRVWLLLAANVAACTLTVAALATGLLLALRQAGIASPAAVAMAAAQAVLAGAYLLTFVVAGHGRYGWLCAALVVATTAHLAAAALLPRLSPLADTTVFLGCAVLLQVLLAAVLAPVVGQVWRYR
jgi:hypothetical protein